MFKKFGIGFIAVVMLLGGVFTFGLSTSPVYASSEAFPPIGNGNGYGSGPDDEALAAELGITVEALTAARTAAHTAVIDEALSQGLITQAQADSLKANGTQVPGQWLRLAGTDFLNQIDLHALLAENLNITPEQLTTAMQNVQQAKIADAVKAGQMTQADADLIQARQALHNSSTWAATMLEQFKNAIQQQVTAGTITQAQADLLIANREARGTMGAQGMGGKMGGMMGGLGVQGMGLNCDPMNLGGMFPGRGPGMMGNGFNR